MSGTATWARSRITKVGTGVLLLIPVLVGAAGCGGGSGGTSPGVETVAADSLVHWMDAGTYFVLLDVRPDSLFEEGRIAGSVRVHGIPFSSFREILPDDPDVPLVFVSEDGSRPPGAPDRAAAEAGFTRVLWLDGGVRGWIASGRPVAGSRIFAH